MSNAIRQRVAEAAYSQPTNHGQREEPKASKRVSTMTNLDLARAHIEQAGMCSKSIALSAKRLLERDYTPSAMQELRSIATSSRFIDDEVDMAIQAMPDRHGSSVLDRARLFLVNTYSERRTGALALAVIVVALYGFSFGISA